jgi:hypothetical protein
MPLQSQAQAAYLKHNEPEVFEEFRKKTPKGKKLPYKKKKKKARLSDSIRKKMKG